MPRKLRTFMTSIGFFDLAVAAPSMKAALEAWDSGQNLFRRGFARETKDPAIVAATMAHPGVGAASRRRHQRRIQRACGSFERGGHEDFDRRRPNAGKARQEG